MMIAPCMIRSDGAPTGPAGGLECTSEVRKGKRCDLRFKAHLHRGVVERFHSVSDLREQCSLSGDLALMSIEATQRAEEDLASQRRSRQGSVELDQPRRLSKLISQCRVRKCRGE